MSRTMRDIVRNPKPHQNAVILLLLYLNPPYRSHGREIYEGTEVVVGCKVKCRL
jgi:hypothetical protein